jgi:hypothetical protein
MKMVVEEMPRDKRHVLIHQLMSESNDASANRTLTIAVVEDTHANEIPDNIDADLYTTTRPESSFTEFSAAPDSDLADALRRNGFDV